MASTKKPSTFMSAMAKYVTTDPRAAAADEAKVTGAMVGGFALFTGNFARRLRYSAQSMLIIGEHLGHAAEEISEYGNALKGEDSPSLTVVPNDTECGVCGGPRLNGDHCIAHPEHVQG
jgi:hypothetical protein